jgi:hypothetical protein
MAGKKRFRNTVSACVLRKSFWNGVPAQKYPWLYGSGTGIIECKEEQIQLLLFIASKSK